LSGAAFFGRHAAERADFLERMKGNTQMVYRSQIVFATVLFLNIFLVLHCRDLRAEETGVVKPGDKVGVQFTCRFPNGEIAASTSTAVAKDSEPKSSIYLPRTIDDPIAVTAGESSKSGPPHDFIALENRTACRQDYGSVA
jgi:hypothetical protein